MYMIRSNPHTHTDYVDGKSPARDMIKRALELGFTSLGFSEHAYQPDIEPLYGLTDPNRKRHWFKEDGALIDCGKEAMRRMIRSCRVLEVNTGGMARSGQPCPYPVQPLLAFWRELGGQVIPSSDCHRAHQLDAFFDIAPEYMRAAGFTECLALGKGDRLFETVSLI